MVRRHEDGQGVGWGDVWSQIDGNNSEISSGNIAYHPSSIKVNNRLNIKDKKWVKGYNPQKAHLHPLRDVCMQYENNPANGFGDLVRKRNTAARPDMVMTISSPLFRGRVPVYRLDKR